MEWYESLQPKVQQLSPVLAKAATQYLLKGEESHNDLCECTCQRCISLTHWWAAQEMLKRMHENKILSPGELLRWFRRMFASHVVGYGLLFHSQATEDRIQEVHRDILAILEEAIEEEHSKLP
jgi:hypothetical protein